MSIVWNYRWYLVGFILVVGAIMISRVLFGKKEDAEEVYWNRLKNNPGYHSLGDCHFNLENVVEGIDTDFTVAVEVIPGEVGRGQECQILARAIKDGWHKIKDRSDRNTHPNRSEDPRYYLRLYNPAQSQD